MGPMKAELRADGLHISGYVNVPGRESRPVITPRGKVIEVIEQRAFQRAIDRADNIVLKVDHERAVTSTNEGNLTVYEDEVGLRAHTVIADEEVIQAARGGKLRGWSFDMKNVVDEIEERAGKLPLRRVKEFNMSEITLAIKKLPAYSSTSIELRAGSEEEVEIRASELDIDVIDKRDKKDKEDKTESIDYSEYDKKIKELER